VRQQDADIIVIGAGIIGLAHAYLAARIGKRVIVLERSPAPVGASIANFGMLWPIGQSPGKLFSMAMESRQLWLEVLQSAELSHTGIGSLHVACHDEEVQVAKEFASLGPAHGYRCEWLDAAAALERSNALRRDTILGALWSDTEVTVDPREVLRKLPLFLQEQYSVEFHWSCPAYAIEDRCVKTTYGDWHADRILVCTGSDFESLYPEFFAQSGLTRCKLQMLRTEPQPVEWKLGPALAGGLTLQFYPSFAICPSLPALQDRIRRQMPEYVRFGIHTMVSQTSLGELTLGDSHEYGLSPSPFNREEIDRLVLEHLQSFLSVPTLSIAERWHGVYAKHPQKPYIRFQPEDRVEIITGLGGAGMTLSFGVAAETFRISAE
jgi:D-hydroxyproline dehydrogenase subunit beta